MMEEQVNFKEFLKRVLWKFSGQKVIGFLISSLSILVVIGASHYWQDISDPVLIKAIDAIKLIAIALLATKGLQNFAGIIKK